ncbi:uncharacterized protein [Pyxicephalus adspersus]
MHFWMKHLHIWQRHILFIYFFKVKTINPQSCLCKMEDTPTRTTQVPSGTKSPLQRTALKDIKNEPALPSGSHDPVCFRKGQAACDSEGKSLFPQQLTVGKNNMCYEDDLGPLKKNTDYLPRPACNSKSFLLSRGSFFSDPTSNIEKKVPDSGQVTLSCTNKYFRTPTTSKGKVKRKLSPVIEQDMNSNMVLGSEGHTMDVACGNLKDASCKKLLDILPYRSSFAMECQEIVKQIKENDNPLNPKDSEAMVWDISCIDSEPPPYDGTPMKSMISMLSSEVSNVSSLFEVSLLDLEKTNMQLPDINSLDCSNKKHIDSVTEGIFYTGDKKDEGCAIKRRKMEPSPIDKAVTFQCQSTNSSTGNLSTAAGFRQIPTSPCERIPLNASQIIEEDGVCNIPTYLKYEEADTLHANQVDQDIRCQWPAQARQEEGNKPCANTTQEIYQPANLTQDIEPAPQQLNTTELGDILQDIIQVTKEDCKANTTIEIKVVPQHTEINNAANSTWDVLPNSVKPLNPEKLLLDITQVIEPETVTNITHDIISIHDSIANTTKVIEPETVTNITHDIITIHDSIANTTQVIAQHSLNTTEEIVSVHHESNWSANTTQVILPVPEDAGNRMQDEGKTKTSVTTEIIAVADTEVTAKIKVCHSRTEEDSFVHDGDKPEIVAEVSFGPIHGDRTLDSNSISSMVKRVECLVLSPEEVKNCIVSPNVVQNSASTCDVLNENNKLSGSTKNSLNVSHLSLSPKKEKITPNKAEDICVTNGEEQAPASDTACTNGALVSTITQSKPASLENSRNTEENDIQGCGVICSSQNKGFPFKASEGHLLDSASCSMIEEENAIDVGVFSCDNLSFVTSTPVTRLNMFQKSCKVSEPQDPNVSLVCKMEPPQKDLSQDSMTTQPKLKAPTEKNKSCKLKSKMVLKLPTKVQKTVQSSQMSGLPSITCRSLDILQKPTEQNVAKETVQTKIPSKGIPVKGTLRPPLAQKTLPRASLGNAQQKIGGKVGNIPPSKIIRSSLSTSKVGSLKPKSAPVSHLPHESSSHKTRSQLCAPSSSGVSRTQNVSGLLVPAPGIHTSGIKSFLKPGHSALHPPLPVSTLHTFLKPKTKLPERTPQEIPWLMSQKKAFLTKEGLLVKQQKPQSLPTPKSDIPTMEPSKFPLTAEESLVLPHAMSEPESVKCSHEETCMSCQGRLERLFREIEELKRQLGEHTRHVSECDGQVQNGSR